MKEKHKKERKKKTFQEKIKSSLIEKKGEKNKTKNKGNGGQALANSWWHNLLECNNIALKLKDGPSK